ncbi:HAD-IA family hydrolase [Azospirillum sp. A39]|uniref:HAD-IA family hydrolase n=1 Tax=Azospirillum sp. A39 TaxID=3462279 RepID=UPI004046367D
MPASPSPACVIFDLDGTLVDSEVLNARGFCDLLDTLHLSSDEMRLTYRGWRLDAVLKDLEGRYGITAPDHFVPSYRSHVAHLYRTELRAFEGVAEALEAIAVPVCVASNAPRTKIEAALDSTGLRRFFGDRLFSAYEVGRWKPDPALFLAAAEGMGVAADDCVVVEDSDVGLQAALAAGMRCVLYAPEPAASDAERSVFRHYSELRRAIAALCAATGSGCPTPP